MLAICPVASCNKSTSYLPLSTCSPNYPSAMRRFPVPNSFLDSGRSVQPHCGKSHPHPPLAMRLSASSLLLSLHHDRCRRLSSCIFLCMATNFELKLSDRVHPTPWLSHREATSVCCLHRCLGFIFFRKRPVKLQDWADGYFGLCLSWAGKCPTIQ